MVVEIFKERADKSEIFHDRNRHYVDNSIRKEANRNLKN
jgi:hypothetical protein